MLYCMDMKSRISNDSRAYDSGKSECVKGIGTVFAVREANGNFSVDKRMVFGE